jgi:class 3 adenylate cyclase
LPQSDDSLLDRDDLRVLVATGRELAAQVNLRPLVQAILEHATRLTDSPAGSVLLYDERRDRLYFAHAVGPDAALVIEQWGEQSAAGVPVGRSKAGEVFRTGRSEMVDAVPEDPNHFKDVDAETASATQSMVCVPLSVGEQRVGVVQILNKRTGRYTDRDRVLLERFADQAAVAIRNARLIEELVAHMGLYQTRGTQDPLALIAELNRPAHAEHLSVLFADMRGFSILSQSLDRPERTQALLNEFLSTIATAVLDEGGIVNKFLGDGLLAFFRNDDYARRAVRAALVMVRGFDTLKKGWDYTINVPIQFLDIGVGIATDDVVLGAIGSGPVRDFTAIGSGVNLSAHLMDSARDGRRILVDKVTYNAARELIRAEGARAERITVPGPGRSVHPYECYHITTQRATRRPSATAAAASAIFVSYSHKDATYLELFRRHMKPYLEASRLVLWDDASIRPGDRWQDSIDRALGEARAAVLLVSPDFLFSDFITSHELPRLLDAAAQRGLRIFWIPISASAYEVTEIRAYQALHDPGRPIDGLEPAEQNSALVRICRSIAETIDV